MKRRDLLERIAELADEQDVEFVLDRHGGRHDVFRFGLLTITVPRHREIEELTARSIVRNCERRGHDRP